MTIGERIKKRREELGISQDDIAKKLGYKSRSSINKIELGVNSLTQSKIKAIADVLATTPAYIMGWDDKASVEKNDTITDIIIKMRKNESLVEVFNEICNLPPKHLASIKAFITVLQQQHTNIK